MLSLKLFTAVLDAFKTLYWENKSEMIHEEKLSHLRFVEDIVLIPDDSQEAREILQHSTQKAEGICKSRK